MTGKETVKDLEKVARGLRRSVIEMLAAAQSGHPGGSLSAADILTVLYFHEMRIDPLNPAWPDRDRFVLSKGHAAPALYAALAHRGYFSTGDLTELRRLGTKLQGHPDMNQVPGVDMSTGSLGQGLSAAVGMALAGKMDGKTYRVHALLGDGEINEGMIWEAAMAAAHYKLDNLVAVIDNNGLQIDGPNATVMNAMPLSDKWSAFGWNVELADGHDMRSLMEAFGTLRQKPGAPGLIIARTVKGKGVSFMENKVQWHGMAPDLTQAGKALDELGSRRAEPVMGADADPAEQVKALRKAGGIKQAGRGKPSGEAKKAGAAKNAGAAKKAAPEKPAAQTKKISQAKKVGSAKPAKPAAQSAESANHPLRASKKEEIPQSEKRDHIQLQRDDEERSSAL